MNITDLIQLTLMNKFSTLEKSQNPKAFFLRLAEYIKYIEKMPLAPVIETQLKKDKSEDEKETIKLGRKVEREIESVRVKLVSYLKSKKLPLNYLNDEHFGQFHGSYDNANDYYLDYQKGLNYRSGDRVDNLYSIVGNMVNGLSFHNETEAIKDFAEIKKDPQDKEFVAEWKISKNIEFYRRAQSILKTKKEIKAWAIFYDHLILVPFTLYDYPRYRDELIEKFKNKKASFWDVANVDAIISEMQNVIIGKEDRPVEFKKDTYLFYAREFTQYIIDLLVQPHWDEYVKDLRRDDATKQVKPSRGLIDNVVTTIQETISWPGDFKWDKDERDFLLGTEARLCFDPGSSHIKDIFNKLLEKQGGWAETKFIGDKLNLMENDVKKHIGHLKNKIMKQKVESYIIVEPRQDPSKKSAYRLVPYPGKKRQAILHKTVQ